MTSLASNASSTATSGLYRDYVELYDKFDLFHIRKSVVERAKSANNSLNFPSHNIWTDKQGIVVDVTTGFLHFTGYQRQDMVGRSCNFLQGKDTDPEDILEIRLAIKKKKEISVVILNYCKDGSPFWNVLSIIPKYEEITSFDMDGLEKKKELKLSAFFSNIIGLPIPPAMQQKPNLCLEDALALIHVFSSVPQTIRVQDEPQPRRRLGVKSNEVLSSDVDSFSSESYVTGSDIEVVEAEEKTIRRTSSDDQLELYKHVNYSARFQEMPLASPAAPSLSAKQLKREYVFIAETPLPTERGRFRVRAYRDPVTGAEPLAFISGDIEHQEHVICRVHDQCVTSEVFGSLKCDCKQQLDYALEYIKEHSGMVLYLPQEGRGIGLANKVAAYALQENQGLDTVDANRQLGLPDDARQYNSARDIIDDLGIKSIRLLTNNPRKIDCLKRLGVTVTDRIACICQPTSELSMNYVKAKAARMGHMIDPSKFSSLT